MIIKRPLSLTRHLVPFMDKGFLLLQKQTPSYSHNEGISLTDYSSILYKHVSITSYVLRRDFQKAVFRYIHS